MITYCDQQCCKNRKICTVYNTLLEHSKTISITVNSCFYLLKEQHLPHDSTSVTDPSALSERIERIKSFQIHGQWSLDAPRSVKAVKSMGMQFDVDDETVS